jgi:prepilin-type N-terminal cleavage/methylation domain-containing protein
MVFMLQKWQLINKPQGFSLMEIVVAMGIMSLVALGYMRLTAQKAQQQRTDNINTAIDNFTADLRGLLSRPGFCQKTFENKTLRQQTPARADAFLTPIGNARYSTGEAMNGGLFLIDSIALQGFERESNEHPHGIATLVVTLQRLGTFYGSAQITREFEMYVERENDGKIINCMPLASFAAPSGARSPRGTGSLISAGDIKDAVGNAEVNLSDRDIQRAIRSNPNIRKMHEALEAVEESNRKMEERFRNFDY